jgi:hypothetical protein
VAVLWVIKSNLDALVLLRRLDRELDHGSG